MTLIVKILFVIAVSLSAPFTQAQNQAPLQTPAIVDAAQAVDHGFALRVQACVAQDLLNPFNRDEVFCILVAQHFGCVANREIGRAHV